MEQLSEAPVYDIDQDRATRDSWAFAVNEMAEHSDVEITLLSLVVVEQLVRMTGLVRVRNRPDVRLASVPDMALSGHDGQALTLVSGHVQPQGAIAWVSWLFQRPARIISVYEARIDRINLDYRVGKRSPQPQAGPWLFRFQLPPLPTVSRMLAALAE
jgi:hypothetical protein